MISPSKDDIGVDDYPIQNKRTMVKTKPKKMSAKMVELEAKRSLYTKILLISLAISLFAAVMRPALVLCPFTNLAASLCAIKLAGLNAKKKAQNYGKLATVFGAIILAIGIYVLVSCLQSTDTSGIMTISILFFYLFLVPPAAVFLVSSIIGIRQHEKTQHPITALVLNVLGAMLLSAALIVPGLYYAF